MDVSALLTEGLGRAPEQVTTLVQGLGEAELAWRPDPDANSIAWLVWHLARVEDDHVAGVAGTAQVWTAAGWAQRFDLPFDDQDFGYGHDSEEVAQVQVSSELLVGYCRAVTARAEDYVGGLTADDLDRVVDEDWDPPVTLGVRLMSVLGDVTSHLGQAEYVRGLLDRR